MAPAKLDVADPEKGQPSSESSPIGTSDDQYETEYDDEDIHEEEEEYPEDITGHDTVAKRRSLFRSIPHPHTSNLSQRLKAILFPEKNSSEELENYVPNYRYIPIISGIVIPFSILLEIPGLTDKWYIRTVGFEIVETKSNPPILDIGLAFSMACAIIANICLILRFLEFRVGLMTIFCIAFLTIHDVINIIAVTVFGVEHRFDDGFTYGQSFWMTVCSTVASSFTNATLIMDLIKTKNFELSGSGLTRKQRSLSIIVIVLLCYIAIGALINSFLLKLTFIDALYFTVVCIETVGFGDVAPTSTGARIFVMLFATFGIINLALAVGMTRETVLEGLEVGYRKRVQDVRRRRRAVVWKRRVYRRWRNAIEWRLRESNQPIWVHDDDRMEQLWLYHVRRVLTWLADKYERGAYAVGLDGLVPEARRGVDDRKGGSGGSGSLANYRHPQLSHPRGMTINLDALSTRQLESAAMEAGVPLDMLVPEDYIKRREERERAKKKTAKSAGSPRSSAAFGLFTSPKASPRNSSFPIDLTQKDAPVINVSQPASGTGTPAAVADRDQPAAPTFPTPNPNGDNGDLPLTHARVGRMVAMLGKFALAVDRSGHLNGNIPRTTARPGHARTRSKLGGVVKVQEGGQGQARPGAGARQRSLSAQHEAFVEGMEMEEKRAFYARLIVAWTLFIVFWTSGAAIFQATEGWKYGEALYFCVVAFTTIGFGDFSPKTAAGRSIFVAWALLGVGAMTVLISVLAEAYSDRYKNALHSGVFDRAVKGYRERTTASENARSNRRRRPTGPPTSLPPGTKPEHTAVALSTAETKLKAHLESMPNQILKTAKAFHQHFNYFNGPGAKGLATGNLSDVPEGLKKLMDDISGEEKLAERIKLEILQDEDARHTLFTLGIEMSLKRMIEAAEEALEALSERDHLVACHQLSQEQDPESQKASSSSTQPILPQRDNRLDNAIPEDPAEGEDKAS